MKTIKELTRRLRNAVTAPVRENSKGDGITRRDLFTRGAAVPVAAVALAFPTASVGRPKNDDAGMMVTYVSAPVSAGSMDSMTVSGEDWDWTLEDDLHDFG